MLTGRRTNYTFSLGALHLLHPVSRRLSITNFFCGDNYRAVRYFSYLAKCLIFWLHTITNCRNYMELMQFLV